MDVLDTAIAVADFAWTGYLLDEQEFLEGFPGGSLLEVERVLGRMWQLALLACDARRGDVDRLLLDARFQSDVVRLDVLAGRACFEGIPLLRGGVVLLRGARAAGTRVLELPDTGVVSLGVWTDVTTIASAQGALLLLDAARTYVSVQRAAIARAREQLQAGLPRSR